MENTGERLTTTIKHETAIHHLHRYAIAIELAKNKEVLDIASGEGYGSNLLSKTAKNVTGVDISREAIEFATKKYKSNNLNFIKGQADKIPLEDNSIDLAVSFETIEHHDKHNEMFNELKRVLRPNGLLIMSSPDKANYSNSTNHDNHFHIKELYREEFKELVTQNFKHSKIYYQNISYNSIIVPEDGLGSNFKEYSGDFLNVNSTPTLAFPVYNICIASDNELTDVNLADFSTYSATEVLEDILNVYDSKTYKIGKMVTQPLRWLRKLSF
ncbi:MAG: methyltransferase domain-containing protein [Vicingaceae bacterium]|nr:methyltransferase domain-containing protein [Vicingaceae bacterium]